MCVGMHDIRTYVSACVYVCVLNACARVHMYAPQRSAEQRGVMYVCMLMYACLHARAHMRMHVRMDTCPHGHLSACACARTC